MATYQVTMKNRTVEYVDGADAYQQEGPMTTFFSTRAGRQVVDCWSTRLASFRTADVLVVRRTDAVTPARAPTDPPAPAAPALLGAHVAA